MRLLLVVLLLAACSSETVTPPPDPCECGERICGFLCTRACGVCPDDGVCSSDGLRCIPSRAFGAPCSSDIQCGTGRICLSSPVIPGGYCSRRCSATDPCPGDGVCTLGPEGEDVCHAACPANTCRTAEGFVCTNAGYCRACVPQCNARTCGDDGCGGSCGECLASGLVCDTGACKDVYGQRSALPKPTHDLGAVDDDGLVVLVGGREVIRFPPGVTETRGVKRVLRWNPQNEVYSALPDLPEAIARPNVAILNGLVYVAGGTTDPETQGASDMAATNFYKLEAGNWRKQATAGLPEVSTGAAIAATKDKVFLFPGETADGLSKKAFAYDPTRDRWFPAADRPVARSYAAAASDGERVYLVGGWDGAHALATVEIFEPSGGWSTSAPLAAATTGPTVTIADGRLFVFGGRTGPFGDAQAYVQVVDLTTRRTTILGTTWNGLVGQAAVTTRSGVFLFSASEFSAGVAVPHDDVVQFRIPAR